MVWYKITVNGPIGPALQNYIFQTMISEIEPTIPDIEIRNFHSGNQESGFEINAPDPSPFNGTHEDFAESVRIVLVENMVTSEIMDISG